MDFSLPAKKNAGAPSLLDLPHATIVQIAELLPCKDVPSFICTCKELAQMATYFYSERRSLDMACFDRISPLLCKQVIDRFAQSSLSRCSFKCDLSPFASSSPWILQAIMERFLDNYRCNEDILRDMQSVSVSESSEWFSGEPAPRPIEALTHCFLLESLLSSQPALKELVLDVEFAIFQVPKSRGYRQHWYLMQPFVALQTIQKACPLLESYGSSRELYQSSAVDMQHVQARFVQNNPKLRFMDIRFGLDTASLERFEHIKGPLMLEKAVFFLPRRCVRSQKKLKGFAEKMMRLESVALAFKSRGTLEHAAGFVRNLPAARSLLLKCEFNAGHPSFDIDEGAETGGFFEGFGALVSSSSKVKKLTMLDVPEAEFDTLFGPQSARFCASLELLRVRFRCSKAEWGGPEHDGAIDAFFRSSRGLRTVSVVASCGSNQDTLAFSKTLSRKVLS